MLPCGEIGSGAVVAQLTTANEFFSTVLAYGSRSKKLTVSKTVPVTTPKNHAKFRLSLDANGRHDSLATATTRWACNSNSSAFPHVLTVNNLFVFFPRAANFLCP
jgi:hypothetical protein